MISYTGVGSGRLLVTPFSAVPYVLGTIYASDGSDGGVNTTCIGDSNDDGVVNNDELWMGHYYHEASNTIYGNAMGDLIKRTGAGATLSDLSTFNTVTPVSLHRRIFTDNINLKADPLNRWIAYTAFRDAYATVGTVNDRLLIAVYDLATGKEELVGSYPNANPAPGPYDGYIRFGGNPAFLRISGTDYLAVTSHYTNSIEIFRYNPAAEVADWTLY
jgi:hypothetical protein